jgi:hypothetical protein
VTAKCLMQDMVCSVWIVSTADACFRSVACAGVVLCGQVVTIFTALKCLRPCSREQSAQHDKACDDEADSASGHSANWFANRSASENR